MSADLVNGLFELTGGVFLCFNLRRLWQDKEVKGVSIPVTVFFLTWGVWNLFYYPYLDQWLSFFGGLLLASANVAWVFLAIYFTYFHKKVPS